MTSTEEPPFKKRIDRLPNMRKIVHRGYSMVWLRNATRIATTAMLLILTILPDAGLCNGGVVHPTVEASCQVECPTCVLQPAHDCCSVESDRDCRAPTWQSDCCGCCKRLPQDRAPENTRPPRQSQAASHRLPVAERESGLRLPIDNPSPKAPAGSLVRATVLCVWLI